MGGFEEYGFLNLGTVMSIAMGNRSVTDEVMYGRTRIRRDKAMQKYDIQLPSEREQHVALSLARRGLRPLYLE
jgi:hypothetical protein